MSKGRDAVLRWCQRNSYGYDGVSIDNFDTSFADGLAFCALLDSVSDFNLYHTCVIMMEITKSLSSSW